MIWYELIWYDMICKSLFWGATKIARTKLTTRSTSSTARPTTPITLKTRTTTPEQPTTKSEQSLISFYTYGGT